jgi:hypothetical protein
MPKTSVNPHITIKIYQGSRFTRVSDAEILSEIPILHVEDARCHGTALVTSATTHWVKSKARLRLALEETFEACSLGF